MSAKTTRDITREMAIERVNQVFPLLLNSDWRAAQENASEDWTADPSESWHKALMMSFVTVPFEADKLTNYQLEQLMDLPFFRFYALDNYSVTDGVELKEWMETNWSEDL